MVKFLVIQTAFIGDVVLATALLEKLHAYFPDAEIDIMVRKGNETLLNSHPFVKEVLIWNKKERKWRNLLKILSIVRKKKYDKVINVQRFAATGFITAFSNSKETIGFNKNPFSHLFTKKVPHRIASGGEVIHEVERNQELISQFTDQVCAKPVLYPSANDLKRISAFTHHPYITISPASVWFTKQYPAEKWVSFLQKLPLQYVVYILGAPGDAHLAERLITASGDRAVNLCGKLSFLQSAALMKEAHMNYVNDSAPLHFSSAVNAPVTAVYCSTIPAFGFGPLSDIQTIVEIPEKLYCRPCGLHGYNACPEGHFLCALKIADEQLIATLPSPST